MRPSAAPGPWTVRACGGCSSRRMMPAENETCLYCEEHAPSRPGRLQEVTALAMLRRSRGYTVEELARRAGVAPSTAARLEERAGTPNPQRAQRRTAERLARALAVEVAALAEERHMRAAA